MRDGLSDSPMNLHFRPNGCLSKEQAALLLQDEHGEDFDLLSMVTMSPAHICQGYNAGVCSACLASLLELNLHAVQIQIQQLSEL